jgi:mono/diheme cytochrome c family protein
VTPRITTSRHSLVAIALALAGHVVVGMASSSEAQDRSLPERWRAPASWAGRVNPVAGRPDLAAGGRKVFLERCANCHAADATGFGHAPDLTSARVQRQSDGALFWKVSTGNAYKGMPTFSFLPEAQRWQVLLYLRSMSRGAPLIR